MFLYSLLFGHYKELKTYPSPTNTPFLEQRSLFCFTRLYNDFIGRIAPRSNRLCRFLMAQALDH